MKLIKILDVTIVLLMIAILTVLSLPVCVSIIEQRTGIGARHVQSPAPLSVRTALS